MPSGTGMHATDPSYWLHDMLEERRQQREENRRESQERQRQSEIDRLKFDRLIQQGEIRELRDELDDLREELRKRR